MRANRVSGQAVEIPDSIPPVTAHDLFVFQLCFPGDRIDRDYGIVPEMFFRVACHFARQARDLRAAIANHHAARGHERCWLNDAELYRAAGLPFEGPQLPPRAEFLRRCEEYYHQQDQGNS